jgi:hypothetical protein
MRGGGRGGGRFGRIPSGRGGRGQINRPRFEGYEPTLKGFIYDYTGERNPEQFVRTTKQVQGWVGSTYKEYVGELMDGVKNLVLDDPIPPPRPTAAEGQPQPDEYDMDEWKYHNRRNIEQVAKYGDFRAGLYNTVWKQCTEALQAKIESHSGFERANRNGIALLCIIKQLMHTFETDRQDLFVELDKIKKDYYTFQQGQYMTLQQYYVMFLNQVEIIKQVGITITDNAALTAIAVHNNCPNDTPNNDDHEEAFQRTIAIRFIMGANKRYGDKYRAHLHNSRLENNNVYPRTLNDAYGIMQRRAEELGGFLHENDGVAFVNDGSPRTQATTNNKDHITCYNCGQKGHYSNKCTSPQVQVTPPTQNPQVQHNETNMCMEGITDECTMSQSKSRIPNRWILLDNQSTTDLFCNKELLTNIRKSESRMNIHCNAGTRSTDMIGELEGYGTVWYDPKAIANILSLKRVRHKYTVKYVEDGEGGAAFVVTKNDGESFRFVESESGLHYLDTEGKMGTILVNTVADNKSSYTNEDYLRAVRARDLQIKIGRPSTRDFVRIVTHNLLPNCPVTKKDIMAAEYILGPDVGSLKGKTTRKAPHKVRRVVEPLPTSIMSCYRNVTICADIMFVNKIPIFLTISRNIRFITVEALPNRTKVNMVKALKSVITIYRRAGFNVMTALMDGEFEHMRGDIAELGVVLNEAARDEHVGEAERCISTVKERMRATYNMLPFHRMPPRMIIEMAKSSAFWLNAFPHINGVSQTMSPRAIISGQAVDFNRHCKYEFGQYVQTHEQHDNSMVPRTIGALATRPTGNTQGNYYFISLSTGQIINRSHATPLPMPDDVIQRVNAMARHQLAGPGLIFMDRDQIPDGDNDDDRDAFDEGNYNDHDPDIEEEGYGEVQYPQDGPDIHAGIVEQPIVVGDDEIIMIPDEDDEVSVVSNGNLNDGMDGVADQQIHGVGNAVADQPMDHVVRQHPEEGNIQGVPGVPEDVNLDMDLRYGPRTQAYNLRARRPRDYSHLFTLKSDATDAPLATPQMNMKQGLKMFGEDGLAAVRAEMLQLHDRKVMQVRKSSDLTRHQRGEALAYLMFLKRKRSGKIKGRGCADGRKQRAYVAREDAASPTVASEAVFLTAVVDALEDRHVAVLDVPGAFMQADMDELVHVRFTGKMVELLLEIDRSMYEPCVTIENGEKVMYVKLLKALYGTLRAARLFWEKLTSKLNEWGFTINPYDPCVANKMVNGKQITVVWHVDDLKVSHVSLEVVDNFVEQMETEFGADAPINKSRGKVHNYLGMCMDFSTPGRVVITMENYIQMVLHDVPEDMNGVAATPAGHHLFRVNECPSPLNIETAKVFVHVVMQLLYLSQKGRPDIRTAISFLCGRLQKPDIDDYKKLTRVVKYLRGTTDMPLTLSADGSGQVRWWIDASYSVHPDMKGHTGGTMTMGKGSVYSTSVKQKLVTRSSTESEVVGLHDVLPQVLWTAHFLREQGMDVKDSVLYQDNLSAMLLEKNGRASSTKRTKHMNLRYFYVHDRVCAKDVTIEHCPTEEMVADYFTKPLQGQLFRKMRAAIMNLDPDSKYCADQRSVLSNQTPEGRDQRKTTISG